MKVVTSVLGFAWLGLAILSLVTQNKEAFWAQLVLSGVWFATSYIITEIQEGRE